MSIMEQKMQEQYEGSEHAQKQSFLAELLEQSNKYKTELRELFELSDDYTLEQFIDDNPQKEDEIENLVKFGDLLTKK